MEEWDTQCHGYCIQTINWLCCVSLASIRCDRSDQLSGHSPDAARTIVQAFIACRLDWCNSLLYHVWCAEEPAQEGAVSAECCRSSVHQRTQMWPHYSGSASVTLAASPETSGIQDCVSCTPVAGFTCTDLPDYWHSSRLRVWSPPPAQKFCCCGTSSVEQFADKSATDDWLYGQFRQYLKAHLFAFWEITAKRDVWLLRYINILTYLPIQRS